MLLAFGFFFVMMNSGVRTFTTGLARSAFFLEMCMIFLAFNFSSMNEFDRVLTYNYGKEKKKRTPNEKQSFIN